MFSPLRTYLILLAVLVYIGLRVIAQLPILPGWQIVAFGLLVTTTMLMRLGLGARARYPQPWADRLTWVGMICMGFFSSLFVYTLVRDVALLVAYWLVPPDARAEVLAYSAVAVVAGAVLASLIGLWNARRPARVVKVSVALSELPKDLAGFTIAQVSDLHVGPTIKGDYVQAIVDKVNALQPDVIALTGDFVDGSVRDLRSHVAPLAQLRAKHGVYMVLGNHEYYAGEREWVQEFRRLGITVLVNEHVAIERNLATLVLAGVTDFSAHHFNRAHKSDPEGALRGAPPATVKILLAHQPRSATAAAEVGYHLQLSGHTHGGQFWPWIHFVRFQQPFTAGLHRVRDMYVYVSRGTGYWGPPKRFGAPSEITRIELVRHTG